MKISVIVPAHNEEKYIGKCLESISKLKTKPYEVIVIDNNCTDRTCDIARSYGAKIVQEKEKGITQARNRGFETAQGDVIARTDADSLVPSDWLTKIEDHFQSEKDIVGLCGPTSFYDFKPFFGSPMPTRLYLYMSYLILRKHVMIGANMILTKKAWEIIKNEVSLNDKDIHEDIDLSIHLMRHGRIKYDSSLVVYQSSRRMKNNPYSFFVLYTIKYMRTYIQNRNALWQKAT